MSPWLIFLGSVAVILGVVMLGVYWVGIQAQKLGRGSWKP